MKQMVNHGVPIGRAPTIELRNMHATYAVTWQVIPLLSKKQSIGVRGQFNQLTLLPAGHIHRYALSAATSVMLWRLFRRAPKRPGSARRFEN